MFYLSCAFCVFFILLLFSVVIMAILSLFSKVNKETVNSMFDSTKRDLHADLMNERRRKRTNKVSQEISEKYNIITKTVDGVDKQYKRFQMEIGQSFTESKPDNAPVYAKADYVSIDDPDEHLSVNFKSDKEGDLQMTIGDTYSMKQFLNEVRSSNV